MALGDYIDPSINFNQNYNLPSSQNTGIMGGGSFGPSSGAVPVQAATHDFDPNTGLSREAWRDQFMGLGSVSPQAADQWLRSHNATQLGGKGDIWNTPYGDTLDLQIGRGAANANGGSITPAWTQVNSLPGSQSNGSVLNNAGSGNLLQALMQLLGSQSPQNNQTMSNGAAPYNPYAGQKQGVSSYFSNMNPTGQSDGTLLGTSFGPSGQVANTAISASNNNMQTGMSQSQPSQTKYKTGFGPSQAMMNNGMTNYSQKNENFQQNPLPQSNLNSNF